MKIYYHFTGDKLRNGKPIPPIGKKLRVRGEIEPCVRGLHASADPFDALQYAPGAILHQVILGGKIIPHGNPVDKVVARQRTIIASRDATEMMRMFARRCALDVANKWEAPQIVLNYLKNGDENLGFAAWSAARDVADAARYAADAARYAADAARAAAWSAARAAADAAKYAARAAAWSAASVAAWEKYRTWFNEAVAELFAKQ